MHFLLFSHQIMSDCDSLDFSMSSFPVPHHLPEFAQVHVHESVMPPNHLNLCCPFLLLPSAFLPSAFYSFPASESFRVNWLFSSGGQSIGGSASASVLPINIQDWVFLGLTDLISLLSKGTLKNLLQHQCLKTSILWHSAFMIQLSNPYMTTGETHGLDNMDLC